MELNETNASIEAVLVRCRGAPCALCDPEAGPEAFSSEPSRFPERDGWPRVDGRVCALARAWLAAASTLRAAAAAAEPVAFGSPNRDISCFSRRCLRMRDSLTPSPARTAIMRSQNAGRFVTTAGSPGSALMYRYRRISDFTFSRRISAAPRRDRNMSRLSCANRRLRRRTHFLSPMPIRSPFDGSSNAF